MGASNKLKQRGNKVLYTSKKQEETKKQKQKLKKCFMVLSALFQFTMANFKRLYLLDFWLNLREPYLLGKLKMSAFTWLKLHAIWNSRLGDIGQKVQHMQTGAVSAALGRRPQLTSFLEI